MKAGAGSSVMDRLLVRALAQPRLYPQRRDPWARAEETEFRRYAAHLRTQIRDGRLTFARAADKLSWAVEVLSAVDIAQVGATVPQWEEAARFFSRLEGWLE